MAREMKLSTIGALIPAIQKKKKKNIYIYIYIYIHNYHTNCILNYSICNKQYLLNKETKHTKINRNFNNFFNEVNSYNFKIQVYTTPKTLHINS